jgi:hypothetical protein
MMIPHVWYVDVHIVIIVPHTWFVLVGDPPSESKTM